MAVGTGETKYVLSVLCHSLLFDWSQNTSPRSLDLPTTKASVVNTYSVHIVSSGLHILWFNLLFFVTNMDTYKPISDMFLPCICWPTGKSDIARTFQDSDNGQRLVPMMMVLAMPVFGPDGACKHRSRTLGSLPVLLLSFAFACGCPP